MKKLTVIGTYPNHATVIVQVECDDPKEARRTAVQHIAVEVYDGQIGEGLGPMNDAIEQVSADFTLVAVLEGWTKSVLVDHKYPTIEHLGSDTE